MIRVKRLPNPAVMLVSDLDDDTGDVEQVSRLAVAYRRAGIGLHVVGLNASPEDEAFIRRLVPTNGIVRQGVAPRRAIDLDDREPTGSVRAPGRRGRHRAGCVRGGKPAVRLEAGMRVLRVVLSVAALALGLVALSLAHDVRAWGQPGAGDGRPVSTWLPGDTASNLVGLEDDIALRRGERAFARAVDPQQTFDRDRVRSRGEAEVALAEAIDVGSPRQASRAGNLVGILAATNDGVADVDAAERRAAGAFDAAIRGDPTNVDARYNLELLFRRLVVVGQREGPGLGSGNVGDSLRGAGAGRPGAGY